MRITAVLLLAGITGCQTIEGVVNPMPTTRGSRISSNLTSLPTPDPARVKSVTVYRFENKTGYPHGLALSNGMTDQLITGLVKTGHFRVVERAALDDLMTEKQLQQSGAASGDAGQTQLKGAQLIFAGSVTELDETGGADFGVARWGGRLGIDLRAAQVGLDMRVIDAATGEIVDSIDVRRTVRKTGLSGSKWGVGGGVQISNAMDLAVRETLEEAVYQLVTRYGAK